MELANRPRRSTIFGGELAMWWLHSEEQMTPIPNRSLPPRKTSPPAAKRQVKPCTSPLIDTLTPDQEKANRVLSQVQCGHEFEIERLLADVEALEKTVRQAASKAESQQATIEQKEGLLRSAEEKAETLHCSLSELDTEIHRLDAELQASNHELQASEQSQLAAREDHEQQVAQCEYRTMISEHRLAELATVIDYTTEQHRRQSGTQSRRIANQGQQIAWLDGVSDQWQSQAFSYRAQSERLASQVEQKQSEVAELRARLANRESILSRKNQELAELTQLRDQLANAEKRASTWQLETQRSHASRRELAEQMRRQKAVDVDAFKQSELQRQQLEQMHKVAQLRVQRLRSENLQLKKQLQQERRERVTDRRLRESEISEVQTLTRTKTIQIEQLKASVEIRDREIIGFKDAMAATQVELGAAWDCSQEAANQLQLREAKLQQAKENEERIVQIQADQARSLQSRIDSLVGELDSLQNEFDTVSECSRMDLDGFERLLSELECVIEQLGVDHDQLRAALDLAQQTNTALLNQAAKSRAQLSGGRAKGVLLIERYEEKLRKAIQTIEALRSQAQPDASKSRRAA